MSRVVEHANPRGVHELEPWQINDHEVGTRGGCPVNRSSQLPADATSSSPTRRDHDCAAKVSDPDMRKRWLCTPRLEIYTRAAQPERITDSDGVVGKRTDPAASRPSTGCRCVLFLTCCTQAA
jgi:hypothetical protein